MTSTSQDNSDYTTVEVVKMREKYFHFKWKCFSVVKRESGFIIITYNRKQTDRDYNLLAKNSVIALPNISFGKIKEKLRL